VHSPRTSAISGPPLLGRRSARRLAVWSVLAATVAAPIAGAQTVSPSSSPLKTFKLTKLDCVNGFVSKPRVAKELANAAGLVGPISAYLVAHPAEASRLYAHLYGDPDLCTSLGCDSADKEALLRAREWLNARLQFGQSSNFTRNTRDTDAARFFSTPDSVDGIICTEPGGTVTPAQVEAPRPPAGSASPPVPAPPAAPGLAGAPPASGAQQAQSAATPASAGLWDLSHFRVRGYAEQMPLPRTTGSAPPVDPDHTDALFDTTQGASINYKYSGQSSTETGSLIGAIGYEFSLESLMGDALRSVIPQTYFVPYFGVDREDTTKPTGKPPKLATQFSTNFIDFGFAATAYVAQPPPTDITKVGPLDVTGHLFILQPQYLENYIDGSDKVSLNLRYIPLTRQFINTYGTPIRDLQNLGVALIADLRLDDGWFVNEGVPADPRINQNYVRIGGRGGAALEYNVSGMYPIDVAAYYTDFYPLSGFGKSLGEFEAFLVLNLGENKLFNVTLQYANGRREDTTQRYNAWTIGLNLHY